MKLNVTDLLNLKWAAKIAADLYDNDGENIANHELYQKLSFLYEEEKTKVQLENPETWKDAKACLDELDLLCKQQYNALMERERCISEIARINSTSFDEWKSNGKSF